MESLQQILRYHARRYPMMQPQDAVKLIYQNVFGGGHLIRDLAACQCALQREYKETPRNNRIPPVEPIGNGLVRVYLGALEGCSYSIEQLGSDFITSAKNHTGTLRGFRIKLEILRQVTESGAFSFSIQELDAYLSEYEKAGYPMVSHSEIYRQAYTPAYRIVLASLLPEYLQ